MGLLLKLDDLMARDHTTWLAPLRRLVYPRPRSSSLKLRPMRNQCPPPLDVRLTTYGPERGYGLAPRPKEIGQQPEKDNRDVHIDERIVVHGWIPIWPKVDGVVSRGRPRGLSINTRDLGLSAEWSP